MQWYWKTLAYQFWFLKYKQHFIYLDLNHIFIHLQVVPSVANLFHTQKCGLSEGLTNCESSNFLPEHKYIFVYAWITNECAPPLYRKYIWKCINSQIWKGGRDSWSTNMDGQLVNKYEEGQLQKCIILVLAIFSIAKLDNKMVNSQKNTEHEPFVFN